MSRILFSCTKALLGGTRPIFVFTCRSRGGVSASETEDKMHGMIRACIVTHYISAPQNNIGQEYVGILTELSSPGN